MSADLDCVTLHEARRYLLWEKEAVFQDVLCSLHVALLCAFFGPCDLEHLSGAEIKDGL